jgi:hypothetical protein
MTAILLLLASASPALACSCSGPAEGLTMLDLIHNSFRYSDAVFTGTVESLYGRHSGHEMDEDDLVTLRVTRWFKGSGGETAEVHSGIGTKWLSTCGYPFALGKEYVVFADRIEDRLSAHLCSLTAPIDRAGGILRYLRREMARPEDRLSPGEHRELMLSRATGRICGTLRRSDGGRMDVVSLNILSADGKIRPAPGRLADFDAGSGAFCISYLSPGAYRLTAVIEERGEERRWVGCYGAPAIEKAATIVVTPGGRFSAADIIAFPQDSFTVEGFLQTEDGFPLNLQAEFLTFESGPGNPFPVARTVPIEPNGHFLASGLPAGQYLAVSSVEANGARWRAEQEVQILGHTNGLRVVLLREPPSPE